MAAAAMAPACATAPMPCAPAPLRAQAASLRPLLAVAAPQQQRAVRCRSVAPAKQAKVGAARQGPAMALAAMPMGSAAAWQSSHGRGDAG